MSYSYIVKSSTYLPKKYSTTEIMDMLYKDEDIKKLARRFSASTGIDNRFISIELENFPNKKLLARESPIEWLSLLYNDLFESKHADFISLSYNMSSHENFVPTISSQLCSELGLTQMMPPPPPKSTFLWDVLPLFSL